MNNKQLKEIKINKVTFIIDYQYQMIVDLISSKFEKETMVIEQMFIQDVKITKIIIDNSISQGCIEDVAFTYFLSMALQNLGELKKAEKLIMKLYHKYPQDILARCAYANHLMFFSNKVDKVPSVFNNRFDIKEISVERELPLITFIHFMAVSCNYYLIKNDMPHFMKYLSYLTEVAPEHEETQMLMKYIDFDNNLSN